MSYVVGIDSSTTATKAVEIAKSLGNAPFATRIEGRLQLYKAGRPYRDN